MSDLRAIEQRLVALFTEGLQLEVPSSDTELLETGLMDSLLLVELLARLEDVFGIQVTVEDLELDRFRSVARIARFVAERQGVVGPEEPSSSG